MHLKSLFILFPTTIFSSPVPYPWPQEEDEAISETSENFLLASPGLGLADPLLGGRLVNPVLGVVGNPFLGGAIVDPLLGNLVNPFFAGLNTVVV